MDAWMIMDEQLRITHLSERGNLAFTSHVISDASPGIPRLEAIAEVEPKRSSLVDLV